jgi:hypothetical protein
MKKYKKSSKKLPLYFSFLIGDSQTNSSDWVLWDAKIPAINVKHAVQMVHVLEFPILKKMFAKHKLTVEPPPYLRAAIQFERIDKSHRGVTINQYKQTGYFIDAHFR